MHCAPWPVVLGVLSSVAAATSPQFNSDERAALEAGEALVEYTQTEASGGAARVSVLVHTPLERVWAVLLSCERSFEYVDGMQACEVIDGDVHHQRVRQSVKKSWLLPRLDYVIEFDRDPYRAIDFRRVAGDLERLEGHWRFAEWAEDGTFLVTHEIRVQPSFPVPRWLVRRSIARDVPDMLRCLRVLAGGSAGPEQAAADRVHCPKAGRGD